MPSGQDKPKYSGKFYWYLSLFFFFGIYLMMKRILIGPVLLDRINRFRVFTLYLAGNGMLISLFRFRDRRYMAGILPIWRKTQNNQSINSERYIVLT